MSSWESLQTQEQSHPSTACSLLPPRTVLVHEWGSHSCAHILYPNLPPLLSLLLRPEYGDLMHFEPFRLSLLTEGPKLSK